MFNWWKRSLITIASVTAGLVLLSPPAQAAIHTVVPGETLWSISLLYETTVDNIKTLNNFELDRIHPGQKLTVPEKEIKPVLTQEKTPASTTATDQSEPTPTQTQVRYVVQSGDSLYQIGLKYDTSVETIMNANGLSTTLIHPGQVLTIPSTTITTHTQTNTASRGNTRPGNNIVEIAERYLNTPYSYGGSGPSSFDCSGFTAYVYAQVGINLPHNAASQAEKGQAVAKSDLQPGDLVFFGYYGSSTIQHVGIYSGGNKFIHASSSSGVRYNSLAQDYYFKNYKCARRL
ncbi:MAG TPA: LysM peptidoglycan-binding domain-containing protein [Firmicutes bacterium]|nr:LysM peptidoglycan-binding domain-containing protein [Bacillota bacterium]